MHIYIYIAHVSYTYYIFPMPDNRCNTLEHDIHEHDIHEHDYIQLSIYLVNVIMRIIWLIYIIYIYSIGKYMSTQLFNNDIPNKILLDYLLSCCREENNVIEFSKSSYKKSIFNKSLDVYLESIKPYYIPSKQHYVTRAISYPRVITLIRQICNHNIIPFSSKIRYDRSTYSIFYYICLPTLRGKQ
jgi:hypothetical protein